MEITKSEYAKWGKFGASIVAPKSNSTTKKPTCWVCWSKFHEAKPILLARPIWEGLEVGAKPAEILAKFLEASKERVLLVEEAFDNDGHAIMTKGDKPEPVLIIKRQREMIDSGADQFGG